MFNYKQTFISLGILYNKNNFNPLKNRDIYNNNNFPPSKPVSGGIWGSTLYSNKKYKSAWEEYIYSKLQPNLFQHRLNSKSTIFNIKPDSKVLELNTIDDVYIELTPTQINSNLALRTIKVSGKVPKVFENHLFIDFEKLPNFYDALYVTQNFANEVDSVLSEFDNSVLDNKPLNTIKITNAKLYVAEMFEDWNVDSMLILNPNCINIISTI